MKKALAVLFAALMVLAFAACQKAPGTPEQCANTSSPLDPQPTDSSGNAVSCPTDYPADWNTGVPYGVNLTNYAGNFYTSYDGQVIDGMLIQGNVYVNHNDVTIKNSAIYTNDPSPAAIRVDPGCDPADGCTGTYRAPAHGLVVQDSDIYADNVTNAHAAIAWQGFSLLRVNVKGFAVGAAAFGNATITDSYFDDFPDTRVEALCPGITANPTQDCTHQDGIHVEYGDNVIANHNTVLMRNLTHAGGSPNSTAALSAGAGNPHANIHFTNNLITAATIVGQVGCGTRPTDPPNADIWFVDNKTSTLPVQPDPVPYDYFDGACWPNLTGNVWYDGPLAGQLNLPLAP